MDASTSVKSKGGTPNRPLTSRPSLSRSTKTGSPTPSPKVATESPRPATSKGGGSMSKPTATKVAATVKEANAAKNTTVRTVAASPNKPKTVTQRDQASPIKPPAKQTTRPQSGEKGAQQTASLLITKNDAAKKTAEGAQLNKTKPGPEGGNTTPSKRNGTVKREVGKPPEHGSVPKDKTLCLRPESSASVPSKPLATALSPTKTLKANSISHKPKQIVPPPEKPVNSTSLSTKATKSPVGPTRPGATTSTAAKPVKTASPLVKAPKPTPVPTKVTKTPTSPVKPVNTSSAPTKPRNVTPVKPPGNTMSTTNQVKVGKRSTTTKASSVSAKPVNNVPTAIKPVKSSAVAQKSVMEERAEATPIVNKITPNETGKTAELEKPFKPQIVAEQGIAIAMNNVINYTTGDDMKTGGELLRESELPLDTNKSIIPTEQRSIEVHSQDKETQLLKSLTQDAKSPTKEVTPLEEVNHSIKDEPMSADPSYEEQKSKEPFEKQPNVHNRHLQEKRTSPLEMPFADPGKPLEEVETAKQLKEGATCEGVHVPIKTVYDEVASSIEPSKEAVELLMEENRSLEEQLAYMDGGTSLNQSERMAIKPLDEETFTTECVEPLEDVVTSSLEQVTPLEEEIVLSDDEPVQQKGILLKKHRNSLKTLDQLEMSPVDPHNPLELLISSTEELTPSEEEVELLKDNKETLQESISSSEPLAMEELACKMDIPKPTAITFSMEPVTCSKEEINTPEDPFGETIINEESKTSSEKEMPLHEILQSTGEVVKHSEEGNIQALYLSQSSAEEVRLVEEPMRSVETLPSSFEVVKPALEYLVETDKYPQENQILSSLELLNPLAANSLSSFDPLTKTKEGITSPEETRSEGSQSLVQLPDRSQHLVTENNNEVSQELRVKEGNASSEKEEEILLIGQQRPLIEQFHSVTEPVRYDAEIYGASIVGSSEHKEQAKQTANMNPEGIHEKCPVGSELFEDPLHELDHRTPEHVTAAEKQLESAEAEVENVSNPVQLGQSVQEPVLFPEKPLTYIDELKTTSVEAANYPEKSIKSSLGQVKCADYDKEIEEPSIHELMGYPEDHTTSPGKSLDTAMFTRSEDKNVLSSEIVHSNTIAPSLPNDQDEFGKSESAMPWTTNNIAFVETSIEPQVNEPSVHVLAPLDPLESVEPKKHEILRQPGEPEDETNMMAPTTEEINYSLHYQVNQPKEPKRSESLTSTENQQSNAELEPVTVLEESSVDSNFYVTMDPTQQARNLSTNQGIEENRPVYVSEEPISLTNEESLEPLDNSTSVLEQTLPREILQQNNSAATLKPTIHIEGGKSAIEISCSDEFTSISQTEASSVQHTFPPATNTISILTTEQNAEVSITSDLFINPLENINPWDQETERESWVLVKIEELSDFKEEPEEKPLRPASLNQDTEAQDEQKAEEDQVERASVCSTLSDPQLAAKSSSETSTPEELRTYEDSSSGVESHSDDAATSPQTTLTPDPDLGIHMGQEEGTETPAGTPASNKGVPPPLQIVDIEGQSQSTSPSSIFAPSENNQIVRKKEMTSSTEPSEHDCEERAKERGAQRGNDD